MALIEKGSMNAGEVSRAARIPYSKVYDALDALHSKGWIDEQRSRPILYTAKAPGTAIEEVNSRFAAARKENEILALKELTGIYESKGEQERPEIWILRGAGQILSQLRSLVLDCRTEMLIALPSAIAPYAEEIVTLLTAIREKGVKIEMLTGSDLDREVLALLRTVAEVRVRSTLFGGGAISDSKQVVLLIGGGDTAASALGIWADHVGLAGFAKDYFQMLWNSEETKRR